MLQRHENDSYRMFRKCFKSHKTISLFYTEAKSNSRISSFNNTNVNPFFFYKSKNCLTVCELGPATYGTWTKYISTVRTPVRVNERRGCEKTIR